MLKHSSPGMITLSTNSTRELLLDVEKKKEKKKGPNRTVEVLERHVDKGKQVACYLFFGRRYIDIE